MVIYVLCDLCKSNLSQTEGLQHQYFSIYFVLIRSNQNK